MRFSKGGNGGGGGGGSFERPPVGYAVGVLAAIYDLGVRETPGGKIGPRHQVCLWWELNHRDSKGAPHQLRDIVTMSTMDGSHLASRMEALLGRDLTPAERENFDPSSVLGKTCKLLLAVSPTKPDGTPFVKAAMPPEKTDPKVVVEGDYSQALPRFVEKIVAEPATVARMVAEARAGGGDLVVLAPRGQVVIPGKAGAPAEPPPAPTAPALPAGWRTATAKDGRTYYVGPNGKTQWTPPAPPAPVEPPPPADEDAPRPGDDDLPF